MPKPQPYHYEYLRHEENTFFLDLKRATRWYPLVSAQSGRHAGAAGLGRDGAVTACEMTEPFGPLLGSRLGDAQTDGKTRDMTTIEEGPPTRPETDSDGSVRPSGMLVGA